MKVRINPKTGTYEDLCESCLGAAFNPDADTLDEQTDAADTVEFLDTIDEYWDEEQ